MSANERSSSAARELTPLSPAVFHILLSLAEGEHHGYALKREIALRTGGQLKLGSGVLYESINNMLELGLIEESDERPDPHLDDERRRYYRITAFGRQVGQAEAARMRDLVRLAAQRLGVPSMPDSPVVSLRLYRWLLRFYPATFRERYAMLLEQEVRDELRQSDGVSAVALLWVRLLADLAISVPQWAVLRNVLSRP